jgi:nucleoside-diphosphate-sugar epimerase
MTPKLTPVLPGRSLGAVIFAMAILVTGAAGFVALNVVEHLLTAGRDVVGLDRIPLPKRASRDFARLPGRLIMIGGSILSDADLSRALTMVPIEAVIHCAVITAGSVRETADPGSVVAVNIQGAVATLVAAARRGVSRFVYPSSGAVYGASAATVDLMDEDLLRPAPVNLYGLTKFAAESILPRVAQTQGLALTVARLGVVFGPWEYATGVRDTLSPMLQTLDLAGAGTEAVLGPPWRGDYTLSRDIAAGLVAIADQPTTPRTVYNLATGRATTAVDWCRALEARLPDFRWRHATEGETWNVDSHAGFDRGAMDIARITADTLYRPAFDLGRAAEHLLAWRR